MSIRQVPLLNGADRLVEVRREGHAPRWFFAETCSEPGCGCRAALIVASRSGAPDDLLAAATLALEARERRLSGPEIEDLVGEEMAVFELDLDTAEAVRVLSDDAAAPGERYPWLHEVLGAVDGDVLEELARLWYRSKGRRPPDDAPQPLASIDEWEPGEPLSWIEAYFGVRTDTFVIDGQCYEAVDLYCTKEGCDCGLVRVRFDNLASDLPELAGVANISDSEPVVLEALDGSQELIERLWSAFQRRHPGYRERHAKRYPRMREFAARLLAYHGSPAARRDELARARWQAARASGRPRAAAMGPSRERREKNRKKRKQRK